MIMLIKRNFLLYFRNRSGVLFSLLGAMISFILYLVFLKANIKTSWSQVPHTNQLLDSWLIGGTLAITGLTTTFSSFSQLAKDRENNVTRDLVLTDLGLVYQLPSEYCHHWIFDANHYVCCHGRLLYLGRSDYL